MRSRAGPKPLDVGTGIVCASFAADGSWLSFGGAHVEHGFIELSALPAFDERARGNAADVREYRARMIEPRHRFLSIEPEPARPALSETVRGYSRRIRHVRGHEGWTMSSTAIARPGSRSMAQQVKFARDGVAAGRPTQVRLTFRGQLDRPALAEITEVSPPLPTGARTQLEAMGQVLRIAAPALPAEVRITVSGHPDGAAWRVSGAAAWVPLAWPSSMDELRLDIDVALIGAAEDRAALRRSRPVADGRPVRASGNVRSSGPSPLIVPRRLLPDLRRIRRRAFAYVRGCTALDVRERGTVILTDHRILPLSWTRDAYYQALLLLGEARAGGQAEPVALVADHLRWLWLTCDRPDGTWARSHHANGRRKDEVYQADQQLYPLLELADYWQLTGDLPDLGAGGAAVGGWPRLVAAVVDRLAGELSTDGLLATDENAADDAVVHSRLLANQVLAWYCLSRLDDLAAPLGLGVAPARLAAAIREATLRTFPMDGPSGPMWAYAVDGSGGRSAYHDANDVPTAMAPLWGFCKTDDPLWLATIRFAFSPANPGYVDGPCGGLGSRHTPGTWPLGVIQEWVAWSLAGDEPAATRVLERLVRLAFADGSLPESSDPDTGRALARHWFAWPGALLGALLVGAELAHDLAAANAVDDERTVLHAAHARRAGGHAG